MPNPFMFTEAYPDDTNDLTDYNSEEAYELGVSAGIDSRSAPNSTQTPEQDKELRGQLHKHVYYAVSAAQRNENSSLGNLSRDDAVSYIEDEVIQLINTEVNKVLDELEEQGLDANYYIPNSPDETYTSGEVVRLSAITAVRQRYPVKEKS